MMPTLLRRLILSIGATLTSDQLRKTRKGKKNEKKGREIENPGNFGNKKISQQVNKAND
jgi:hypothetical protein